MSQPTDFEAQIQKIIYKELDKISWVYGIKPFSVKLANIISKAHNKAVAEIYEDCNKRIETALRAVGGKNDELEAELKYLDERLKQLEKRKDE